MSAQLVPINAGTAPAVQISRPVILIGRHPECDVRIDSPQVSRRHCCLAMAYDRLVTGDLGSSNALRGTGQVVAEARLNHGDEVANPQFRSRPVIPDPAPPPPPPAKTPKPPAALPPPIIDL